jgi:hypothetical protein
MDRRNPCRRRPTGAGDGLLAPDRAASMPASSRHMRPTRHGDPTRALEGLHALVSAPEIACRRHANVSPGLLSATHQRGTLDIGHPVDTIAVAIIVNGERKCPRQILTERTPSINDIPDLYISFAKTLRPYDTSITFNYDILLERALEAAHVPYRLFPDRLESVSKFSATVDSREETEVIVLKMHGSVDWFDKGYFIERQRDAQDHGYPSYVPSDPVFNSRGAYTLSRLWFRGPDLLTIHSVKYTD